jgi:hypothetical protein
LDPGLPHYDATLPSEARTLDGRARVLLAMAALTLEEIAARFPVDHAHFDSESLVLPCPRARRTRPPGIEA